MISYSLTISSLTILNNSFSLTKRSHEFVFLDFVKVVRGVSFLTFAYN